MGRILETIFDKVFNENAAWFLVLLGVLLAGITLVCGYFGYRDAGLNIGEALYATIALYFVNPVEPENLTPNWLIWCARFAGFFMLSLFVLAVAFGLTYQKIMPLLMGWRKGFTVIYTDNEWGRKLAGETKYAWLVKGNADDATAIKGKDAIILYSDDLTALNFYSRNLARFRDRNVYLALARVDSFQLAKTPEAENVTLHYFGVLDLAARNYWRKHCLYDLLETPQQRKPAPTRIAIIGYGPVGKAIFKYGYLNNLYSLGQEIHYHVWGCAGAEKSFLDGLNQDAQRMLDHIHAHDCDWRETPDALRTMDRIIVALEDPVDALQALLHINPQCEIHCYSGEDTIFEDIFRSSRIRTFGVNDVLNGNDIKEERMFRGAKLIDFDYWLHHTDEGIAFNESKGNEQRSGLDTDEEAKMEERWRSLDGFFQGSNIAAADHYWIKKRLKEKYGESNREIRELEHIRWCRFYFYNHWEYGTEKNPILRRHHDLVPFGSLPPNTQNKDEVSDPFKELLDKCLENSTNNNREGEQP